MNCRKNHAILFCITGGIAAYKMPEAVHSLVKEGHEVRVFLTSAAEKFVSPFLMSTLTGNQVLREADFFGDATGWTIPHIRLAEWADLAVVAPCTANSLGELAEGRAQNFLGAFFLAFRKKVLLFPSMNSAMWEHDATRHHAERCRSFGYSTVEPAEGLLACGTVGKGKMQPNENILEEIRRSLHPKKDFRDKTVLVTAGPTWEYLDPVRFISNPSSGKMGYALAREAWYRGGRVLFVSGPVSSLNTYGFEDFPVISALEMQGCLRELRNDYDLLCMAAAVGDYRALTLEERKIKRGDAESIDLPLVQNPDLIAEMGAAKKAHQVILGFAAETEDLESNAEKKLRRKNIDYIGANAVSGAQGAFGADTNRVLLLGRKGERASFSGTKAEVASAILDAVGPAE